MGKNWFSVDPKEHLDGKVAIVTGGGTGIGAACAETLAAAGAKIVVAARRKEKLESTVSSIREAGGLTRLYLKPYPRTEGLTSLYLTREWPFQDAIPLILPGRTGAGFLT